MLIHSSPHNNPVRYGLMSCLHVKLKKKKGRGGERLAETDHLIWGWAEIGNQVCVVSNVQVFDTTFYWDLGQFGLGLGE